MILMMVRAAAKPGKGGELQKALEAISHKTSCLGFDAYRSPTDKNGFLFILKWDDKKGDAGKWRPAAGDAFLRPMESLTPLCDRIDIELHSVSETSRNRTLTAGGASEVAAPSLRASRGYFTGRDGLEPRQSDLGEQAVRQVESFICAHLEENLVAADLAAVVGVSPRTLFRNFQRHRGLSPMKVLEAARMKQARGRLLQGGRDTVTRVATDSGFTHLGRFSGAYKRKYGEAPSETLSRSRRELGRRVSPYDYPSRGVVAGPPTGVPRDVASAPSAGDGIGPVPRVALTH